MSSDLSTIDLKASGLLVIDMQNAFCHDRGSLARVDGADVTSIREMISSLARVVRVCREAHIPDFWSLQQHYQNDATVRPEKGYPHNLKQRRIPALKGTWDGQIVDELQPLVTDQSEVFIKNRPGCFYNSTLESLLRIHGIDTLFITGVDTNVCVETTVREAYMRDFDIVILEDCVGGVNAEWHQAALDIWRRYVGTVIPSEDLVSMIEHLSPDGEETA